MDNGFVRTHRRHVRELNVVPILDMMTTLIIFLLQITSFLEFTKITVPPSSTVTITDPVRPPPMSPRLILMHKPSAHGYRVQLSWTGAKPGEKHAIYQQKDGVDVDQESKDLLVACQKIIAEFRKEFPKESTFQLGIGSKIPYQHLIALMDGVQQAFSAPKEVAATAPGTPNSPAAPAAGTPPTKTDELANIVLVSYAEVDAETSRSGADL